MFLKGLQPECGSTLSKAPSAGLCVKALPGKHTFSGPTELACTDSRPVPDTVEQVTLSDSKTFTSRFLLVLGATREAFNYRQQQPLG